MNNCLHCNTSFAKRHSKQVYCSLSCSTTNRNKLKGDKKAELYKLNPALCIKCAEPLPQKIASNRFCSSSCAASTNNVGRINKFTTFSRCKHCDTEFRHGSNKRHYCSNTCQSAWKQSSSLQKYLAGALTERATIRKILTEERGYTCEVCGISEWNKQAISLHVDHKDGNASNNDPNNLRLICPNCHSQTETYGGKNKGQGRKARGLSLR